MFNVLNYKNKKKVCMLLAALSFSSLNATTLQDTLETLMKKNPEIEAIKLNQEAQQKYIDEEEIHIFQQLILQLIMIQ